MKIVATISSERVLVEMSARELANVTGKDYESELRPREQPYGSHKDGLEVGTEYMVSPAWFRLMSQERASKELESVSKTLSALADLVTQTKVQLVNCTAEGSIEGGAK